MIRPVRPTPTHEEGVSFLRPFERCLRSEASAAPRRKSPQKTRTSKQLTCRDAPPHARRRANNTPAALGNIGPHVHPWRLTAARFFGAAFFFAGPFFDVRFAAIRFGFGFGLLACAARRYASRSRPNSSLTFAEMVGSTT